MDLLQRAEVAKRTADLATKILIDDLLKAAGLFQVAEPAPAVEPEPEQEQAAATEPDLTEGPDQEEPGEDITEVPPE